MSVVRSFRRLFGIFSSASESTRSKLLGSRMLTLPGPLEELMNKIEPKLDRIQVASWAPCGRRPPQLDGFRIVRDTFVRCQTTTATYGRVRQYQSTTNDAKILWQYKRQKGWLKPWKITIVADDRNGLSYEEVGNVLKYCRHYRFLTVEIAVDFDPSAGVNRRFVREHAVFGKSHRGA
jgi:hypothetical protein